MNPVLSRIALAALLVAVLGSPAAAQRRARQSDGGRASAPAARRAEPRATSPRGEARQNEPARQERSVERARSSEQRARGTDYEGRVRAPRGDEGRADRAANWPEARERATARSAALPRTTFSRPETAPQAAPVREVRAVQRARGTDDEGRIRAPRGYENGEWRNPAEPRAGVPPSATFTQPDTRVNAAARGNRAQNTAASAEEEQRRAEPRGSRPRGDNRAVGRAVPRDGRVYRGDGRIYSGRGRDSIVYAPRYSVRGRTFYNNYYYYYPRRYYPYGYGAFGGLGYFYYDPFTWYAYDPYWSRPYYYSGGIYGGYASSYYNTGEIRLQVVPRHAEVYVDGYFAGHVDDFDGTFQSLRLEDGPYKIEIVAPGYETLELDIRIQPGRKITYRGELRPRP